MLSAGAPVIYPTKFPAEIGAGAQDFTPPKMLSAGTPIIYPTKFPAEIIAGTPDFTPRKILRILRGGPEIYPISKL